MKRFLFLCCFLYGGLTAQTHYLHCGQLLDTPNKTVRSEVTVLVDGKTIMGVSPRLPRRAGRRGSHRPEGPLRIAGPDGHARPYRTRIQSQALRK